MLDLALQGYVRAMKCEHRELDELLRDLQRALNEAVVRNWPQAAMVNIVNHLKVLERRLTAHFQSEEEGGFLEDAKVALPRRSEELASLLTEHDQMLVRLRELVAMGEGIKWGSFHAWRPFVEGVTALVKQLRSHEARENVLLIEAFNDANGS